MIDHVLRVVDPNRYRRRVLRNLIASGRVEMGAHSYGIPEVRLYDNDPTRLRIGRYCSIAAGVNILLGGNHPTDRLTTFPIRHKLGLPGAGTDGYPCSKGDVVIGNDVWIGFGATIVSGVHIGDGAIVAAGSIVVRSVEPYSIVAGNPATLVRKRFDDDVIARLRALRWWDWDDDRVADGVADLAGEDPLEALARLEKGAAR
ncbi:CatB-related O-acetyltransferase [Rhodococcus sp. BP-252]|uniref:Acetyltransferase n=1 Tax=Rhodococcoides kyotonense TaxID=398843 RepID=A0A177YI40_9NOCA|nr:MULTISPECIES: CatB-related O-acetyltransferase [Rhodococcus]MBY6412265.1 CatB-related O-acetyltransferase [Rhodococcus sp. BP-320]MBY6416845.1 CatB-related O-acetyltransferase [Rhodococcus sp. BP-321]MBY6421617.1 CatB-related O-acetyltransferase [Rhodococcus sp. BP-324]MBY6426883.1 CatB-related O-acetyltransferase [Rhodococcus sp. BP-323]MBY6432049.1 CatB-related O-acetyltransferase [Rhodococcus sp. BP-322]